MLETSAGLNNAVVEGQKWKGLITKCINDNMIIIFREIGKDLSILGKLPI